METPRIADAALGLRHVFLRDLVLQACIGVYPREYVRPQTIRVNVDLGVEDEAACLPGGIGPDEFSRVLDYTHVADAVRRIIGAGHVRLVETLAERIAATCLDDPRVCLVRVRVEKLDIFPDAEAAGVEVERRRR
jgi:7,8-dihydroneopterin aldolase/epimerase/oxygenase